MAPTIEAVERTPIRLPLRDRPQHHLAREHAHYNYYDVFAVELSDGSTGWADASISWPLDDRDDGFEGILGREAVEAMWDDSLPRAVQRAVFDAVGRALGAPVHRLLGPQRHDRVPLSWWCMDMPEEDWLAECEAAIDRGYRAVKLKGRPWRDVREGVRYLSEHLPGWFEISIDFNRMLLDADRAIPVLRDLDGHPQVESIEGPIAYDDMAGNRRIQDAIDADLVLHYGSSPPSAAVCEGIPDGFVFYGAPAGRSMHQAHVAEIGEVPGFLQYPGTGLSAAFMLHYGAVFETATLPAVSVYELYEHPLIGERIPVTDGYAEVPDDPGIGYGVDRDALEEFEVALPEEEPDPPILTEVALSDGTRVYMASNDQKQLGIDGEVPYFEEGTTTRLVPDDGSDDWRALYERTLEDEPLVVEGNPLGG